MLWWWMAAMMAQWTMGPVVLERGAAGSFDSVAVKDPSIVRHGGKWHLFYTARGEEGYRVGYVSGEKLADLGRGRRVLLDQLRSVNAAYAAAPQVFYFRPHKKWYLIFQTTDGNYQPVYAVADDAGKPESWSKATPLVAKKDAGKWIDFWVICDERKAYLFFTRDHRQVMVMSTPVERFPEGFGEMREVFAPVHEAVHVYAVKGGRPRYAMLYEQQDGDLRRFGLAGADQLDGKWTVREERFAAGEGLTGAGKWTDEVSHGELLRAGWDERLEVEPGGWQYLVQGMKRGAHRGPYPQLPWILGLIGVDEKWRWPGK